jgi:phage FluMu gp28-like protein
VLPFRAYQNRWIDDRELFKLAVKSARIGFTFGTAGEAVFDCLEHPKTTWVYLAAAKHQALEFIEEAVTPIAKAMREVAHTFPVEKFADEMGESEYLQHKVKFRNDSRIIALPSNPRTARGYPGNVILDEFAHHEDSYSIWAAMTRQIALGHKIRVLSTPNGQQGKFYDLAKDFGLADGVPPVPNPLFKDDWSCHWIDAPMAIAQGCPIDLKKMRNLMKDDDTFNQEFMCIFNASTGAWLPLELIANSEDAAATVDWPAGYEPVGPLYGGIDVAREHDKTVLWVDEQLGEISITRLVLRLHGMPFPDQQRMLQPWVKRLTRCALDSTGMGIALYDYLNEACPGRMMGVNFAGTNDNGVKLKTDLAVRIKQKMEKAHSRIPRDPEIRQAFQAIKREATPSGVKFDAPRIEMDTSASQGPRRKAWGHADEFWAKALADLAADQPVYHLKGVAATLGEPVMAGMDRLWG